MAESDNAPGNRAPTLAEVLEDVIDRTPNHPDEFNRLVVMRATPHQYAYRVYPVDDEDWEGGIIEYPLVADQS